MEENNTGTKPTAHCVIKVDYVGVALSGTIELGYVGNVEPFNKGRPNFRPEPVAKHEPDLVLGFLLAPGRLVRRYPHISPMYWEAVTLYLTQPAQ